MDSWMHVLCVLVTDVLRKRNIGFIESHQHNRLQFCLDWNGCEGTFDFCDDCILVRRGERAFVNCRVFVSSANIFLGVDSDNLFRVELVILKGMYMSSDSVVIDISEPICFDEVDGLVGRHFNG